MLVSKDEPRQMPVIKPRQIASWGHLAGYLAITAGIALWGFQTQKAGLGSAPSGQIVEHSQAIRTYFFSILADWALLYYCWVGVHRYGGNLKTLTGGRWTSWKQVLVDL